MTEKLASSEIAQSRERFEKAFTAKYYTSDPIASWTMADLWEQAERDTRERCAQIVTEEIATNIGPTGGWLDSPKAITASLLERIRGKE